MITPPSGEVKQIADPGLLRNEETSLQIPLLPGDVSEIHQERRKKLRHVRHGVGGA